MASGLNTAELIPWYVFQNAFVDIIQSQSISVVGGPALATTGSTHSNKTLDTLASTTNIQVGQSVAGTGIPANTFVAAISGTTVTLTQAATATASGVSVSFSWDGLPVPDAYRDATGWPNANPPGGTGFQMSLGAPAIGENYSIAWLGSVGSITGFNYNSVSAPGTNSMVINPHTIAQAIAGNQTFFQWTLPGSGNATKFSCRPVADPGGLLTANWKTKAKALLGTGPLRVMRATTVEANGHPTTLADDGSFTFPNLKFPVDGDGLLADPILTGANRNTPTMGAEWWNRRDGVPFEVWVQVANALDVPLWFPIHYNSDTSYRTSIANSAANGFDPANGWGPLVHELYCENGNEPWNGSPYTLFHQLVAEGLALGYGPDQVTAAMHRYALQAAARFDEMSPIFAAAGKTAKFKRVYAWQAVAPATRLDDIIGSAGAGHADVWSVADYFGPDGTAYPSSYTGADIAGLIASANASVDDVIANMATHLARATANGMDFVPYEGGPGFNYSTQSTVDAIHTHPAFHDLVARFVNERRRVYGGKGCYFNMGVPWQTGDHEYGLLPYITDPIDSTRPAALALSEAVQGHFTMFDPVLQNVTAVSDSPANSIVANFGPGLLPEAIYALTEASGKFTVDTSGNVKTIGANPPAGSYPYTLIQTDGAALNSPKNTAGSLTVLTALLKDNFNDNVLGPEWATGTALVAIAIGAGSAAGMTITNTGGQLQIAFTTTNGNRGSSLYSAASNIDVTDGRRRWFGCSQAANENGGMAFGAAGGNVLHLNRSNGNLVTEVWDGTGYHDQSLGIPSINTTLVRFVGFRYVGGNLHIDTAPAGVDPTVEANWTVDVKVGTWPSTVPTTGTIGLFAYNNFGATVNDTFIFDAFNTAP